MVTRVTKSTCWSLGITSLCVESNRMLVLYRGVTLAWGLGNAGGIGGIVVVSLTYFSPP